MSQVKLGLEDVVIANSEICSVDGQRGKLVCRGFDIHDLAENATFEEVVYLLWNGRTPNRTELDELPRQLAENRPIAAELVDLMKRLPPPQQPM